MPEFLSHFDTLHKYAAATLTHWTICGLAGILTVRSHYRGGPALRLIATVVALWWVSYEATEFARIHDNGDVDIANGLASYIMGAVLAWIFHKAYVKWKTR